ncbi:DUF397 domain-containing protein [Actinoallomurus soli]|nr:DUF397 domain-containing protein [Actinoallomurus soli]MCO5972674.1 DUF397 domain-containing protein [Actinoallomurus soli]
MSQSPTSSWRKSSHSGGGSGNCVEIAVVGESQRA